MSSTPSGYLSIADIARQLDLPESTTRYYCKRFLPHLACNGEGRRRRYTRESLETIRFIAEEMQRTKNAYAVDLALSAAAKAQAQLPAPKNQTNPAGRKKNSAVTPLAPSVEYDYSMPLIMQLMEKQTDALQQIASAMALFASHHPAVQYTQEVRLLQSEMETLRKSLLEAEAKQLKELEQTRKWLASITEAMANRGA